MNTSSIPYGKLWSTLSLLALGMLLLSPLFGQPGPELQWDANDPSDDVAGYNMYRSGTSGTGYALLNSPDLIVDVTYTDTQVTIGQTYYYVVTAINNAQLESGFSNEVPFTVVDPICLGDVDLDGSRNLFDVLMLHDHIVERDLLLGQGLLNADCNQDGGVNFWDVVILHDHIVERVLLPACQ